MSAWRAYRFAALLPALSACSPPAPQQSQFTYPSSAAAPCPAIAAPARSDTEQTARGITFSVRAPSNYNARYPHALLVMYAPAGYNRHHAERYYDDVTGAATAAGFVVAYPDHVRLSLPAIEALGAVPAQVARKWCIDPARVYFAGHSDGASVSMGVPLLGKSSLAPAALAVSGAGIRGSDLARYQCPRPTPITLSHSIEDEHFPGFGEETIAWWAKCNGCAARSAQPDGDGCYTYASCVCATRFCPTHGKHARWPGSAAALLRFLNASAAAR